MSQTKVDPRQLWIEALRSGEFTQGRGTLLREDKFCCLGVACELYRRETGEGFWGNSPDAPAIFILNGNPYSGYWPAEVGDWLGIKHFLKLAKLNDIGSDFREIADDIESGRFDND